MRNRIGELDDLIRFLLNRGYEFLSVRGLVDVANGRRALPRKACMLRVDVDSDPDCCLLFAEVFKAHGCDASFYFRLSTMDIGIMQQLYRDGFEVGYHFEELATVAKRENLKTPEEALARIEVCRQEFRSNFAYFTDVSGIRSTTVASHGDFANRRLDVKNWIIVDDAIRKDLGIEAEAYDSKLTDLFSDIIADRGPPEWWAPDSPKTLATRAANEPHCMRLLIHPKQWRRHIRWNTRQNVERLIEGLQYR